MSKFTELVSKIHSIGLSSEERIAINQIDDIARTLCIVAESVLDHTYANLDDADELTEQDALVKKQLEEAVDYFKTGKAPSF